MLVLIPRQSRPDAPYWLGRRLLAAVDALVWPIVCALLVLHLSGTAGLSRPVAAVSALWAFFRLCCAVLANHRYWFTTWVFVRVVAVLLVVDGVVKLALPG